MEKNKILILYMPVIHEGYLDLFRKDEFDEIFVLDKDIISFLVENGLEYLSRDLRCLHPETLLQLIGPIFGAKAIHLKDFDRINFGDSQVYMPFDEIGRSVKEFFLPNKEIIWVNRFLRWHKEISVTRSVIDSGVVVSEDELVKHFLNLSAGEAQKSSDWWRQVGCVLKLKDGSILKSYNRHMPHEHIPEIDGNSRIDFPPGERIDLVTAIHAEASVISKAAKEGISASGSSLYVTTFPCPVCARLIVESGIKKVFYRDGYSLLDGEEILKSAGVEIVLVK